jgi:hypothetical protein
LYRLCRLDEDDLAHRLFRCWLQEVATQGLRIDFGGN